MRPPQAMEADLRHANPCSHRHDRFVQGLLRAEFAERAVSLLGRAGCAAQHGTGKRRLISTWSESVSTSFVGRDTTCHNETDNRNGSD